MNYDEVLTDTFPMIGSIHSPECTDYRGLPRMLVEIIEKSLDTFTLLGPRLSVYNKPLEEGVVHTSRTWLNMQRQTQSIWLIYNGYSFLCEFSSINIWENADDEINKSSVIISHMDDLIRLENL